MRLLIIDDDKAHGESLADLLNTRGHEAYFASSIGEAAWLLDLFSFDLALIDFDMPDLSGPEVAQKLRHIDPELRSIVMSARENDPERRDELGPLPFLAKPISVEELLDLVVEVSRRSAGSSLVVRAGFPVVRYRPQKR